jgi:hypothetical protein
MLEKYAHFFLYVMLHISAVALNKLFIVRIRNSKEVITL